MNTALGRTEIAYLTNKSGGSVAQGDVVIVDTANASAFTTTTSSAYVSGRVGVVIEPNGIANNSSGLVAFGGYVPIVNLSGTGSIGDLVKTHTVAKQGVRHSAPQVAGDFAQVLATSATPAALLFGTVQLGSGSSSVVYPKTATMWHDQSLVTTGNAIRLSANTNQPYNRYADQNTPANGDVSHNGFFVAAGTYTLKFLIVKDADGGKLDITIDGGSVVGTVNFFNGSVQWGQVASIASVVISTDGYHKMTMTVNGKDGSDYHCYITKMWMEPSAF